MIIVVDDEFARRAEKVDPLWNDARGFTHFNPAFSFLVERWTSQQRIQGNAHIDELWLDHDLGFYTNTGPIVRWMAACAEIGHPLDVDHVLIHTMNSVAADSLWRILDGVGYNVDRYAI